VPDAETREQEAAALKALFDAQLLSQAVFGRRYDIGGQSMVSQYLNARRPLNLQAAINFSRGLRVAVSEFSPRLSVLASEAAPSAGDQPPIDQPKGGGNLMPVAQALEVLGIALAAAPASSREALATNLAGWARDGGQGQWPAAVFTLLHAQPSKRQSGA